MIAEQLLQLLAGDVQLRSEHRYHPVAHPRLVLQGREQVG
ncbi:hypothetical protein MPS_5717 [Mycobacterium pseudoshottsii JCM 15466]|nr:hypothetical protein MPS_5717 [Mycobacterium pseudoshottsii JCM 15466]